jgi:hypothetical protein
MCVQYWPPNKEKDETYGDISVGIVQEEELANFHIRTFRLYKKEKDVSKLILKHSCLFIPIATNVLSNIQRHFSLYQTVSLSVT